VCDYWICRASSLRVSSLYDPKGIHYYTMGVNPRAALAFIFGIVPNMPGLAAACGAKGIPKGATYLYSLSWLVSILVSGSTYWLLWKMWPFPVDQKADVYIEGQAPRGHSPFQENDQEKLDLDKRER
jgi:nucleobase:cation symporter-1, NCS1 family